MPPRFILDENLRGKLWRGIVRHNSKGADLIDCVRVGDPMNPPRQTKDPVLLQWAAKERRIIVTVDKTTMPVHFLALLERGEHSAGVFIIRDRSTLNAVVDFLAAADFASTAEEWLDRIQFIP
jgi:hypothetical protein